MKIKDRNKYKTEFKDALHTFSDELKGYVSSDNGDWSVKGFIDVYKNVYAISPDTKLISKILEIHILPKLLEFADKAGYKVVLSEHQNYYPDFTFVNRENEDVKFAVDLKTSYRRNNSVASFTLGSHGSYFKERDKRKNIQFPYNSYLGHYCLGIVYTRTEEQNAEVFRVKELEDESDTYNICDEKKAMHLDVQKLESVASVIKDLDFFVAEKWKIASDKHGSGNTANIGVTLNLDDLRNENGVFSRLGEEWFDEYWMNYGLATMIKEGKTVKITNIKDFLEFKGRTDLLSKIVMKK